MRVALLTGSAGDNRCGVGDYSYELAQHLALDAEVDLLYDREHGPLQPPVAELKSLRLHPLSGFSLMLLPSLTRKLRDGEYDIIHVQYPGKGYGNSLTPGFIPRNLSGMNSRSRIVVTLHEWTTSHPLRKMVMDQMLPYAEGIITSNETDLMAVAQKVSGKPVIALPVGNVLASRAELRSVWDGPSQNPYDFPPPLAGCSGRRPRSIFHYGIAARGKNLKLLLEAVKNLRENDVPATLYLGGDFSSNDSNTEDVLGLITELGLADAVVRLGHLTRDQLAAEAQSCMVGVFPFEEGFSSKRSSVASISLLELPLVVGHGSYEEHPYYAPKDISAIALGALLAELLNGRAENEWNAQISRQREFARRFSFANISSSHFDLYSALRSGTAIKRI